MVEYWYKAFITKSTGYVLLDGSRDIRASAPDVDGNVFARRHFGWGTIHKFKFDGKTLKIGAEIE